MKNLQIGVIGAGGRGIIAQLAHKPERGSLISAVCDTNEAVLSHCKKIYGRGTLLTSDYRVLLSLKNIDAVFITSPDHLHAEHAVAAMKAGKHVYCEKPLAISIKDTDRILSAAKKYKRKLYVGHNMRHMGFVIKMKELVDSGKIGEVKSAWVRHFISYGGDAYFKDWHSEKKYTGSLLIQKAVHDIDIIHWICSSYTRRVSAMGSLSVYDRCHRRLHSERPDTSWNMENWPPLSQKNLSPIINVEDQNMMLMELQNGIMASYVQCHFTPDAWRNYTFIGTEGRIENFDDFSGSAKIKLWNRRSFYREDCDEEYTIENKPGFHGGADERIVNEFIGYLRNNVNISVSPVDARYAAAACICAADSVNKKAKPINIPKIKKKIINYFGSLK